MGNNGQASVITLSKMNKGTRKALSASWKSAAGMVRHHSRGLDRYIARVRKEWK